MLLDAPRLEDAEDARWSLVNLARDDSEVVEWWLAALPSLTSPGQVEAVEGLTDLGDRRADAAVIELLGSSDDDLVRQYCAWYVTELRVCAAVPALRRAYRVSRDRGDRPDLLGPAAVRNALTVLGARTPVVPDRTTELLLDRDRLRALFGIDDLEVVLDDLAASGQVVLAVGYCDRWPDGQLTSLGSFSYGDLLVGVEPESWPGWVQSTRDRAQADLRIVRPGYRPADGAAVVAAVDWIDRCDV